MPNLLLEIYNEEIPAGYIEGMQAKLVNDMMYGFHSRLFSNVNLEGITSYSTPRRLIIYIQGIDPVSEDTKHRIWWGPPEHVAFKDGKPTKAAKGFAKKFGKTVDDIEVEGKDGDRYCFLKYIEKARSAKEILAEIIPEAISKVGAPKSMTWIPGNKFTWPRPIRHILALLDDKVIKFDFHGIPVGRITRGHPFHGKREIEIESADIEKFKDELEKEFVILDFDKRKGKIKILIDNAFKSEGAHFNDIKLSKLLNEVTNLVEWPDVIVGGFDEEFLSLPKEIVQVAMMEHQRYFPMEKEDGTLINKFVAISNRPKRFDESDEEFVKVQDSVRAGNERVIHARLADAQFFFEEDRKKKLKDYVPKLSGMLYHEELGSNLNKVNRLEKLCEKIGLMLDYDEKVIKSTKQAAKLSRADLVTQMVGEFPSLQGVVGRIYAQEDGEKPEVFQSIEWQYKPRHVHHWKPSVRKAITLLAISDNLDSLTSFFAVNIEPKGNQDPYALRRAAITLFLLLLEVKTNATPKEIFNLAINNLPKEIRLKRDNLVNHLIRFLGDRILVYYSHRNYPIDHLYSILGHRYWDNPKLIQYRLFWEKPLPVVPLELDAFKELHNRSGWFDLVKSVQRCRPGKIAKDLEEKGLDVNAPPDEKLFKSEEDEEGKYERKLYKLFKEVAERFIKLTDERKYLEAGEYFLDKMKDPINEFYDKVFVNVKDPELRLNRVRLTGAIYELFAENFADMAEIAGPEKTSEQ